MRTRDGQQRLDDVTGQHDVALHLVELLGHDGRQRILLAVHGALLQGQIHFCEGDRGGVGADRFRQHQIERRRRHAQLHALHVLGLLDFLVGGDHALAVIGQRLDLVLGLVLVALGDVAEQFAVAIGLPVIEVAQHEWRAGDCQRLVDRTGERGAGIDDVDGAEAEPLIDLVLVAELGSRKHLDLIPAVGTLLDFFGRPQRLGVIGLGDLVDMRPFQLGLGRGWPRDDGGRDDECCR